MERARLRPHYHYGIGETGQSLLAAAAAAAGAVSTVLWLWSAQQVSHEDAAAAAAAARGMMFLNGYCRRCCEHDRERSRLFFLWPMSGLSCRSVPHTPSKPLLVLPLPCGPEHCCAELVVVPRGWALSRMGSRKCGPNR
ncbi:unnamed protein product, partial [Ectocarpus fasciculatus]